MEVTVGKIGTGTEEDPIRPDTTATWWEMVSDNGDTFTIRILEQ